MITKLKNICIISFAIFTLTVLMDCQEAKSAYNNNPSMSSDLVETFKDMEARLEEADKLYKKAKEYFKRKEYEKAIEYFEKSIKKNPDSIKAHNDLAWLLITSKDPKYRDLNRAILHAKKAVSGDEFACGHCWDTLGLAYYKLGEIEKAHISYLKAMTLLGPSNKDSMNNYITILSREQPDLPVKRIDLINSLVLKNDVSELRKEAERLQYEENKPLEALDYYTVALLYSPNDSKSFYIHYRRAKLWLDLKELNLAFFDTRQTIKRTESFPQVYSLRGIIYGLAEMYEKSIKEFNKAVALAPDDAIIYLNRATTYMSLHKYSEALDDITRAIELKPSYAKSYCIRAQAYRALKEFSLAMKDLKEALKLDPLNKRAKSLIDEIQEVAAKSKQGNLK